MTVLSRFGHGERTAGKGSHRGARFRSSGGLSERRGIPGKLEETLQFRLDLCKYMEKSEVLESWKTLEGPLEANKFLKSVECHFHFKLFIIRSRLKSQGFLLLLKATARVCFLFKY